MCEDNVHFISPWPARSHCRPPRSISLFWPSVTCECACVICSILVKPRAVFVIANRSNNNVKKITFFVEFIYFFNTALYIYIYVLRYMSRHVTHVWRMCMNLVYIDCCTINASIMNNFSPYFFLIKCAMMKQKMKKKNEMNTHTAHLVWLEGGGPAYDWLLPFAVMPVICYFSLLSSNVLI